MTKPLLTILLAGPRGFCAGVDRAILIVEKAIETYGAPVYVRHEIVHNRHVVRTLELKGAVFVEELDQVPKGVPVIFSAHGVPKSEPALAEARGLQYIDATCPLVSKVHFEAERHHRRNRQTILIGHADHPEVIGTMGQVPKGSMILIETAKEARSVTPKDPKNLAFVTQTTLSVDDTAEIVAVLRERFPEIVGPRKEDICYATTNRQKAVKAISKSSDMLIVIGSLNSSNSKRLVEVGRKEGCSNAFLVNQASEIPWDQLKSGMTLGLTAGASAPDILVEEVIEMANKTFEITVQEVKVAEENVIFNLPRGLNA
ncbi:MAG: 4-hydroxy-3-methylbut-2-enyl diphosphate reductase [Rhodospirillaceae bacterium]